MGWPQYPLPGEILAFAVLQKQQTNATFYWNKGAFPLQSVGTSWLEGFDGFPITIWKFNIGGPKQGGPKT